jgi:DNA invertase Pin-like site-specific DNA recombinase
VVAEALDRLSRDQEDVAALFKRFHFAGIAIITLAEGQITPLHVGLKGAMNSIFLQDLADKTRRGLRGRIEDRKSAGGNSFGYDVAQSENARGRRVINETQAAIVRQVFEHYAGGISPKRIALQLNKLAIPSPRGGAWSSSTINGNRRRGTGIINNELYVGRMVWNRLTYVKDPESGRRRSRANRPQDFRTW